MIFFYKASERSLIKQGEKRTFKKGKCVEWMASTPINIIEKHSNGCSLPGGRQLVFGLGAEAGDIKLA